MERNQKIILGVLLVVVILGGGAYVLLRKKETVAPASQTTKKAQTFQKTDAPVGQLATGFPKELILDPKAATKDSYSIKYDSAKQYTAEFKSEMAVADIYKLYTDYFNGNGYTIKNHASSNTFSSIYAIKGNVIVNAIFTRIDAAPTTTVSISYVQ